MNLNIYQAHRLYCDNCWITMFVILKCDNFHSEPKTAPVSDDHWSNLSFPPSEDQSRGRPSKVRCELSPERVQLEGQRADAAPETKREQWLNKAHPHHCRNNDVSALCERNKIDVLSVLLSYLLTLIMVGLHCPVYSR